MTSFLETQLKSQIGKGFKGRLLTGTLRRFTNEGSGGLDDYGDPATPTPADYAFEGFVSQYSAFAKSNSGIPESDEKVIIIADSITVEPQRDDYVKLRNEWRKIRRLNSTDPGRAVFVCQSYRVQEEPT